MRFFKKKSQGITPLFMPLSFAQSFLAGVSDVSDKKLMMYYLTVPELQAVINYRAKVFSDMEIKARNTKTYDEVEVPPLFEHINPLQNTKQFLKQTLILKDVFGDVFQHVVFGTDKKQSFGIFNLPPVEAKVNINTTDPFRIRNKKDLITGYEIQFRDKKILYKPDEIIHVAENQIEFDGTKFVMGDSKIRALVQPLENIKTSYEARGILMGNSALGILSNETKDGMGSVIDLPNEEKDQLQRDYQMKYGLSRDKWSLIMTNLSLKWQDMSFDISKLKLFDEVKEDLNAICNAFAFSPEIFQTQTTFANKEAALIQLYEVIQGEAAEYMRALNQYFEFDNIELYADYSHIKILQGDIQKKAQTWNTATMALNRAFTDKTISVDEYRYVLEKIGML